MGTSAWHGLVGTLGYLAGAAGTAQVPSGCIVIAIYAHATAAASMTIFGGASIPLPAGVQFQIDNKHTLMQAGPGAAGQIVFTGTDSYFVQYARIGHAS